jgi:hypothetical protein
MEQCARRNDVIIFKGDECEQEELFTILFFIGRMPSQTSLLVNVRSCGPRYPFANAKLWIFHFDSGEQGAPLNNSPDCSDKKVQKVRGGKKIHLWQEVIFLSVLPIQQDNWDEVAVEKLFQRPWKWEEKTKLHSDGMKLPARVYSGKKKTFNC